MPRATLAAIRRRDPVARLGFWISFGVFIAVALAWWTWWKATNEDRVRLTLYFSSTVHGLDEGAPVKIQGVPVGQVESLGVRIPPPSDSKKKHVAFPRRDASPGYYAEVHVVLDSALLEEKGLPRRLDDPEPLKAEIARGLRGRIRILSPMSGRRYLELEYSPRDKPLFVASPGENVAEVPTLDDPLALGLVAFSQKLAELEKRDFSAIEAEINQRLDAIAVAADPAGVKAVNDAVLAKLAGVRAALTDEKLRARFATVNADLVAARRALVAYDEKTGAGSEALSAAAEKLRVDLAGAAADTEVIATALDPRSPSLLLAYQRLASVRDNATRVRNLCREVMNTNGLIADFFRKSAGTEADVPKE